MTSNKTIEHKIEEPNSKNVEIGDFVVDIAYDNWGEPILAIYLITDVGNNFIYYYERGSCLAYSTSPKSKRLSFGNALILKRNGTYLLGTKIYQGSLKELLSTKAYNFLKDNGIDTIDKLLRIREEQLPQLKFSKTNKKSIEEVKRLLYELYEFESGS